MPAKSKHRPLILLLVILVLAALLTMPTTSFAQAETAYDLINTVYVLRDSQGLAPYQIDTALMAYAQQHSDYQASILQSTHSHSDGTVSLNVGVYENAAGGDSGFLTMSVVVYEIWADPVHMKTMTGFSTGVIGAGMAVDTNNTMYITLNVRPGDTITTVVPPAAEPTAVVAPALNLVTSTPNADGSVTHVVRDGESLWSIATAYGVSVEQIQNLNGMTSDFTVINIGQNLLIYAAGSLPTSAVVATLEIPAIETQVLSTATVQRATATANLVKPVGDINGTEAALAKAAALQTLATPEAPARKLTAGKIVGVIVVPIVGVLLLLFVLNFQGFDHWKLPWKH